MDVRSWLSRNPRLMRVGWAVRMLAITGPWHPLLLAYCRRCAGNPRLEASPRSARLGLDVPLVAARLERDGWADGFRLPDDLIDRILEFTERSPQQRYDEPHRHCEALREVACDADVLEVARRYLGGEPVLFRSVIWRNKGVKDPEKVRDFHIYRFHFDVADVKSVVLFVYLSDVDERSGPHVVIPGTHGRKSLWDTVRIYLDDQTVQSRYPGRIKVVTGGRGTAFFEEQTTYHKQMMPQDCRMILAITYTLWRAPDRRRRLPRLRRGPGRRPISS